MIRTANGMIAALALALCPWVSQPVAAQETVNAVAAVAPAGSPVGATTRSPAGHPLPRFVSVKGSTAAARRGPGWDHRIDWVYQRRGMPLLVTAEFEHWRRVEDIDGEGGWMHVSVLSGVRTVIVAQDMTPLRRRPQPNSLEVALLEAGVIGRVLECAPVWCRLSVDDETGWAERSALWGLLADEVLD